MPFERDWYKFLKHALINCRTPKKKDRLRDIEEDKQYYRATCFLTHKDFNKEESYKIADGYIEKALQNPVKWNELYDRYETYYEVQLLKSSKEALP